jgi:hypothetical protein
MQDAVVHIPTGTTCDSMSLPRRVRHVHLPIMTGSVLIFALAFLALLAFAITLRNVSSAECPGCLTAERLRMELEGDQSAASFGQEAAGRERPTALLSKAPARRKCTVCLKRLGGTVSNA